MKLHYIVVAIIAVVTLTLVGLQRAFPYAYRQDLRIDSKIVSDFSSIETEVQDYVTDEGELPDRLEDLVPSATMQNRIELLNYEYTTDDEGYEICAEFRTDASDEDEDQFEIFGSLLNSSISQDDFLREEDEPSRDNNPEFHGAGRQCYDYDAGFYGSSYDSEYLQDLLRDYNTSQQSQ